MFSPEQLAWAVANDVPTLLDNVGKGVTVPVDRHYIFRHIRQTILSRHHFFPER